jgi:polyhydroxybutyrate depolymerase
MRSWWVIAVLGLVTLAGCGAATEDRHQETEDRRSGQSGTWTITSGGQSRSYRLYVPASAPDPAPLVLMLHGAFGNAEHAQRHYGWDAAADRYGLVVAYPDGWHRSWAAGGCCGRPDRDGIDDVGFLTDVVADVSRRIAIDQRQIFAAGMSNGGMMAYRLACDTTLFAAVASVAGTAVGDCPDPAPVSVLHIHGLDDDVIRFDGGQGRAGDAVAGRPVATVMDLWRTTAGCPAPSEVTEGEVTTSRVECPQGRVIELVTIAGAGHQWPGGTLAPQQRAWDADPPSDAIDATTLIAEFFLAHPRSGGA